MPDRERILVEYEKKANEIARKMLLIFIHAQRKVDDLKYRKVVKKLEAYK